jgi:hypothetical protein
MDLEDVEPYLSRAWVLLVGVVLIVAAKVLVALVTTHGADPKDKPEILRAVGDMFRPWRRGGRAP